MGLIWGGAPAFARNGDLDYPASGPFYSGQFAKPVTGPSKVLRFVSYNINFGKKLDEVIHDLETIPELVTADFILLQEVTGTLGGESNGAEIIARKLGMNYLFAPGCVQNDQDYGNAVLSRHPITDFRKVLLPYSNGDNQRTAVGVRATVNGTELLVYSLHLNVYYTRANHGEQARGLQLAAAVDEMNSAPTLPAFFAGDFNTFHKVGIRGIQSVAARSGFEDAHPVVGWTFRPLRIQLDHAYSRGLRPQQAGTSHAAQGSDHVPIWADVLAP